MERYRCLGLTLLKNSRWSRQGGLHWPARPCGDKLLDVSVCFKKMVKPFA